MFDIQQHLPTVQAALDGLAYDFAQFEITDFVRHIETRRQRPIIIKDDPLTDGWFGAWVPLETADYVFLRPHVHRAHYLHNLLHELAHIVLKHRGIDLREVLDVASLAKLGVTRSGGHLRAPGRFRDTVEDGQAELFVYLLQGYLVQAHRLHELYGAITSIEHLKRYMDGLDLNS
mgnify:CR=1 FL=1